MHTGSIDLYGSTNLKGRVYSQSFSLASLLAEGWLIQLSMLVCSVILLLAESGSGAGVCGVCHRAYRGGLLPLVACSHVARGLHAACGTKLPQAAAGVRQAERRACTTPQG